MAGVWTEPAKRDDGAFPTAAILTTGPNAVLRPLHHRMPVLLDPDELAAWLDPDLPLPAVLALLDPAPADAVRVWPVSTAVNGVRNDGPELLSRVELPPSLGLGVG
jgi:putative SOS response-associated peptidase YedK